MPVAACSELREREASRPKPRAPSPALRSPRRPSPPRRKEPEYSVRVAPYPITLLERDYHDTIRRHARLYVSADFSKTVSCWIQVNRCVGLCVSLLPDAYIYRQVRHQGNGQQHQL